MTRRLRLAQGFLRPLAAAAFVALGGDMERADARDLPPVRALTRRTGRGPAFHWFGYYDKLQFDPTGRYVLGMEVGFEGRSPRPDDVIKVGMVDLEDGDRWIELGPSRAWCWQQGCMLQWVPTSLAEATEADRSLGRGRPGSASEILWNDREDGIEDGSEKGRFVCRVLDVETRELRTVPHAVYALSPDGRAAVAPDFARIQDMRPGYGYAGLGDAHADEMAPADTGIFRIDLRTGERELVVSIADAASFGERHASMEGAKHYFNHLLFNTDGSRFVFLHRWRPDGGKGGFETRMLTAAPDGSDLRVVDPSGHTSHFIWRDPGHILAWTRPRGLAWGFYLFDEATGEFERVGKGVMMRNGHCSYLPGGEWILNDTYPAGGRRVQELYLYGATSGRKVPLGRFPLPPEYKGEWRCDLHPRASRDGRKVVIDSAHGEGGLKGRQMYLIDIGGALP